MRASQSNSSSCGDPNLQKFVVLGNTDNTDIFLVAGFPRVIAEDVWAAPGTCVVVDVKKHNEVAWLF